MDQLFSILTLICALTAGIILGRIPVLRRFQSSRPYTAARNATLFILVFSMGFRIGRTETVVANLPRLGLISLVFAGSTIAGTLAVLTLIFMFQGRGRGALDSRAPARGTPHDATPAASATPAWIAGLKDPLLLLAVLLAGFAVGMFAPLFREATGEVAITVILYVLLALIGAGLSGSDIRLAEILTHPVLLILPLGTVAGSLAGGLAAGLLFGTPVGTALALASGLGWYSLSGVILTGLDGPGTGAIAFLSNMFRETLSLILIPLLARTRFPLLAIGTGGATSMDVTLPLIEKNCGPRSVAFAMASGGALSLCVPVLVPLLYRLGR